MEFQKFENSVYRLYDFFGRDKRPKSSRINMWFEDIEFLSDNAVPWVEKKIRQDSENLPWNMAKAFATYYNAWKSENHSEINEFEPVPCDECGGKGLLWYKMQINGIWYPYSGPCRMCQNWKQTLGEGHNKQYLTIAIIQANGWLVSGPTLWAHPELWAYPKQFAPPGGPKNMKKILSSVGQKMMKFSRHNEQGELLVDCTECQSGAFGDSTCEIGRKVSSGGRTACEKGKLFPALGKTGGNNG